MGCGGGGDQGDPLCRHLVRGRRCVLSSLQRRTARPDQRRRIRRWVGLCAGVALVTSLWILLGRPSDLWTSHYGQAVTIKLGFVAYLLSLAAFNKLRLTPRLQANDARAAFSFRRSIRFEMLLAV